jgi:uncharacterized membrane protein HdeD (DUF308 family)
MLEKITRNWWLFALRGVVAVIFGIVALIRPEQMLQALVLMFGAYALVDGIFTVIAGRINFQYDSWQRLATRRIY